MNKIEHIGIAVNNLSEANALISKLLGTECYKQEFVESESVTTAFFHLGESKLELLGTGNPESAIGKFLAKRGEGIHHIAIAVDDIHQEMARLQRAGFTMLNETPKKGADNKLICFLHPKTTNGILVELCQDIRP